MRKLHHVKFATNLPCGVSPRAIWRRGAESLFVWAQRSRFAHAGVTVSHYGAKPDEIPAVIPSRPLRFYKCLPSHLRLWPAHCRKSHCFNDSFSLWRWNRTPPTRHAKRNGRAAGRGSALWGRYGFPNWKRLSKPSGRARGSGAGPRINKQKHFCGRAFTASVEPATKRVRLLNGPSCPARPSDPLLTMLRAWGSCPLALRGHTGHWVSLSRIERRGG